MAGLLPPTMSASLGYSFNKNFWLNDDIWKLRKVSPHNEFYPGSTSQIYIDLAKKLSSVGIELSPARTEVGVNRILPINPYSALLNGAYTAAVGAIDPKEKENIDKSVWQYLTAMPGICKYLRTTYPQRADMVQLQKDMVMYDINPSLPNVKEKTYKQIESELSQKKLKEGDIQIENDRKIAVLSETLLKDAAKGTQQISDFMPGAIDRMPTEPQKKAESDRLPGRLKYLQKKAAVTKPVK
jgi:hypothetical protein